MRADHDPGVPALSQVAGATSHCPLCQKIEFTFEKQTQERLHEVRRAHCDRFVSEDDWLRYLQVRPPAHMLLEEFRMITKTAGAVGFVFNICGRLLGRAPLT